MGFLLHNGNSCLVAWRVDSGNEPPVEPADETLFEGRNFAGRAVSAEDDLFAVVVKGIKGVEEFFLALLTFPQELNIVDYQRINSTKLALKAGQISFLDCSNKPVDEIFTTQKLDDLAIKFPLGFETDSLQEMGFSQAGVAVNKKWVVGIAW